MKINRQAKTNQRPSAGSRSHTHTHSHTQRPLLVFTDMFVNACLSCNWEEKVDLTGKEAKKGRVEGMAWPLPSPR